MPALCYSPQFEVNSLIDDLVKSLIAMSFRAKREILMAQHIETVRFLPAVEMTESLCMTFYEAVNDCKMKKCLSRAAEKYLVRPAMTKIAKPDTF
jgi:hypothetical protein